MGLSSNEPSRCSRCLRSRPPARGEEMCLCACLRFLTVEVKEKCLWRESVFSLCSASLITAVLAADAQ